MNVNYSCKVFTSGRGHILVGQATIKQKYKYIIATMVKAMIRKSYQKRTTKETNEFRDPEGCDIQTEAQNINGKKSELDCLPVRGKRLCKDPDLVASLEPLHT